MTMTHLFLFYFNFSFVAVYVSVGSLVFTPFNRRFPPQIHHRLASHRSDVDAHLTATVTSPEAQSEIR